MGRRQRKRRAAVSRGTGNGAGIGAVHALSEASPQVSRAHIRRQAAALTTRHAPPAGVPAHTRLHWLLLLLRLWSYRITLVGCTVALAGALYWVQNRLGAVPAHPTALQRAIQWAELIWLVPVPLALALWIGWFIFAEAARPDPPPMLVPTIRSGSVRGVPVRLVFRFVTRGDNREVISASINALHAAFATYRETPGPYRVEITSELPLQLDCSHGERLYIVPPEYVPAHGSRYKARALTYLQQLVAPEPGDWYVYLDEESVVDAAVLAGIYRFIARALEAERSGARPRLIGQGGILYQGGSWFYRGADVLRTADDLGRFRLQYALGMPLFGIHGS